MKTCFLCNNSGKLTEFNNASFEKCKLMSLFRKKKKYKYNDITLNSDTVQIYGYHLQCYKKFTVLKQKDKEEFQHYCQSQTDLTSSEQTPSELEQLIPQVQPVVTPNKKLPCIFCEIVEKKIGNRRVYVSFPNSEETIEEIKKIATFNDDKRILKILDSKKKLAYHGICLTSYQVKIRRLTAEQPDPGFWHECRVWHKNAFHALSALITEEIIEKRSVMYLTDIFFRYKALLLEFMTDKMSVEDVTDYRIETLELKIMNAFSDSITVETSDEPLRKRILYVRDIEKSELASKAANLQKKGNNKLEHAAYELRNCVKNINVKKLPEKLTADDIIQGECDIPQKLLDFISNLIEGPDIRRKNSDEDSIKIKSLCSDIIYIITKGRVKPSKHTEMTHTAHEENKVIPSGIDAVSERSTHVAFDNFDRFVDTSSGKDTLHDTVGIIYQFKADKSSDEFDMSEIEMETTNLSNTTDIVQNTGESSSRPRKRRRFEGVLHDI